MVNCSFSTIVERDMDLLLLEAVATDPDFTKLLVDKTDLAGKSFEVVSVDLSRSDNDGESDVTIVIESDGKKYGLLVEDKINAPAMDEQHSRYHKRAKKDIKKGTYQDYRIFIFCSEKYRNQNEEAKLYEHFLSYEECKKYFDSKDDSISQIRGQRVAQAINKAKTTSETHVDENANAFFRKYMDYKEAHHNSLVITTSRKSNGYWAHYRTRFSGNIYLYHKINEGHVDLTFNKAADKISTLEHVESWAKRHGIEKVNAVVTSASAALRIKVPPLDMQKPFESYSEETIEECFEAIQELIDLANIAQSVGSLDPAGK